jgi:hypothetical protein
VTIIPDLIDHRTNFVVKGCLGIFYDEGKLSYGLFPLNQIIRVI